MMFDVSTPWKRTMHGEYDRTLLGHALHVSLRKVEGKLFYDVLIDGEQLHDMTAEYLATAKKRAERYILETHGR